MTETYFEYYVILYRNCHFFQGPKTERSFFDVREATRFVKKIKPNCHRCVFRVDCIAAEYCKRLKFMRLSNNGTTTNLMPKIGEELPDA